MVLFDGRGTDALEIIDQADAAMYQAKEAGRNRVCFHGDSARMAEAKSGGQ